MTAKKLYRLLLFIISLLPAGMGYAASTPAAEYLGGCNLPAPTNLQISNIGATTATLSWNPVSGAAGYQVFLSANGNPPTASGITTSTSMNLTGLAPGTTYTVDVYSLCTIFPNVEKSTLFVSAQFTTNIIIEIICEAQSGAPNYINIPGGPNNTYTYPWQWPQQETYYFKVQPLPGQGNWTAKFRFDRSTNPTSRFTIRPMPGNPAGVSLGRNDINTQLQVYCGQPNGGGLTDHFYIKMNNTLVASGVFTDNEWLQFDQFTNYVYSVWKSTGGAPPEQSDDISTSTDETTSGTGLVPSPNPFHDVLYLYGEAPVSELLIDLYDARGQRVRQITLAPADYADGRMSMPLEELPAGIYYLQLKTANGNSTHKLLKF